MATEELLDFFRNVGSGETASSTLRLTYIKEIETIAFNEEDPGLSAEQVHKLVSAITNFKYSAKKSAKSRKATLETTWPHLHNCSILGLPPTQSCRLISCIVPKEKIDGGILGSFTSWTLTNFRRLHLKHSLEPALRWINCLLHYNISEASEIHCLYEPFFHLLGLASVRSLVLDILFKLTASRKDLVTKWRVEKLIRLKRKDPENPQLIALLLRMQDLRPDLVLEKLVRPKKLRKGCTGRMEKTFASIWNDKECHGTVDGDLLGVPLQIWSLEEDNEIKNKCLIPPLTEESIADPPPAKKQRLISIYECRTLRDLVNNLNRLKCPSQAMSLMGSPHTFYLLCLSRNSAEVQERLSITLYYTLHNEFFSMARSKGQCKRKLDLLCRINQIQDYFQQGLPVVGRFLAQYLPTWDGEEFFVEICKMIVYLQMTEFIELEECILAPLRSLFNNKLSCVHQLLTLNYLAKLAQHWACMEYERYKNCITGPFPVSHRTIQEGPLDSIFGLTQVISQMAEIGLCQLVQNTGKDPNHRLLLNTFIQETLFTFHTLSRCFVMKEIPIRPRLPAAFVYFSLFGKSAVCLSRSLEFITSIKHEIIPMVMRVIGKLDEEDDELGKNVASLQIQKMSDLNVVAKDALSILATEKYLTRGESIFRQEWAIDEEVIKDGLSLTSHFGLMPYILKYQETQKSEEVSFDDFAKLLGQHLPRVTEFIETFQAKVKEVTPTDSQSQVSQCASVDESATTSGIGSMDDQRTRRRKL